MKRTHTPMSVRLRGMGLALLVLGLLAPAVVQAQDRPPQRQIRTYIPPDQLVSFLPETPFDQFIAFLNPIFQRVTGKQAIDPEGYTNPIGISIAGMHFLDAFELVLDFNGLTYRETDQYFIVQPAPEAPVAAVADPASGRAGGPAPAQVPATSKTREVQINAILFELNLNKARDIGLDWSVFLGESSGSGGNSGGSSGGNSGGTGTSGQGSTRFFLKTDKVFQDLEDYIQAPELMDFADLASFFRLLEDEGVGETVANPQVTVQSGQQGRIQIGSDIPIQTRDFAGNTVTQFFSTGIIIDVLPTVVAETDSAGREVEFIHMDVRVENSSGRPSTAGTVIDRNTADTQVLLLDGEQTVIGGLYSTQESYSRRGIPILKDLPNWFFGLGYIFGRTVRNTVQKELLIVLQAEMLDPVTARAERPLRRNLLEQRRQEIQNRVGQFSEEVSRRTPLPPVNN